MSEAITKALEPNQVAIVFTQKNNRMGFAIHISDTNAETETEEAKTQAVYYMALGMLTELDNKGAWLRYFNRGMKVHQGLFEEDVNAKING